MLVCGALYQHNMYNQQMDVFTLLKTILFRGRSTQTSTPRQVVFTIYKATGELLFLIDGVVFVSLNVSTLE